ncbi:hypothetical protein [Viridibacillus arvi]|uniref:hypothetical protein n=1 Tax=Viridibacillus arvi TaxID=263475 RepID=UPI003D05B168
MKKRTKLKIEKIKITMEMNLSLETIEQHLPIKSKVFGNNYYVGSYEPNMYVHFILKDLPAWKFGIWTDKEIAHYQYFGEYSPLINSGFSPYNTYISEKNINDFIQKIIEIKKNERLYVVDSYTAHIALIDDNVVEPIHTYQDMLYINDKGEYDFKRDTTVTKESYVEEMWSKLQEEIQQKKIDEQLHRKESFNYFKTLLEIEDVAAVGIDDMIRWNSPQRYHITLLVPTWLELNKDDFQNKFESLCKEIKNKNEEIWEKHKSKHTFDLTILTSDTESIKHRDYVLK